MPRAKAPKPGGDEQGIRDYFSAIGKRGGKARARKLTKERRLEIARGARARQSELIRRGLQAEREEGAP